MNKVYLSRRNLLALLSKLDRRAAGENTHCTIVKRDTQHPEYAQTVADLHVIAVEDDEYYKDRDPGIMYPPDEAAINQS